MQYKHRIYSLLLICAVLIFSLGFIRTSSIHFLSKNPVSSVIKPSSYISDNQLKIDVLHYDIKIDIDPEEKMLYGDVEIKGVYKDKNISTLDLNLYDNLTISKIFLNNVLTDFSNKDTRLSIPVNQIKSDTFTVRVIYSGTPKRLGLSSFVFGEINGNKLTFTLNEPDFASTWFPCNDIPTDKALLDMYITSDSSYVSVSNGILADVTNNGAKRTYHWTTIYPISTYLICFYSSSFQSFSDTYITDNNDTLHFQYYAIPEHIEKAKIDWKDNPEYIETFSKLFGEYPFIKEKYGVAEFLWQPGAMENQTITGIGTRYVDGNKMYGDIYVHEAAHSWWGDAVGPATWKDIWLNEGFATYSEALYGEYHSGKTALRTAMMDKYEEKFDGTLYNPGEDLFCSKVYNKGAWVLHMLRFEVGDSTFFTILRSYYQTFKYKNASTDDFKNICEKVSGKNLTKFFSQWVYTGTGILKLNYKWNVKEEKDAYYLSINVEQVQKEYQYYEFPLEIKVENKTGETIYKFNVTSAKYSTKIKLDKYPDDVILDPNNWLLAKITDLTGTN